MGDAAAITAAFGGGLPPGISVFTGLDTCSIVIYNIWYVISILRAKYADPHLNMYAVVVQGLATCQLIQKVSNSI